MPVPTRSVPLTSTPHDLSPPDAGSDLVVLHSLRRSSTPGSTYTDLVSGSCPPGTELKFFSWSTALRGRFDVFHMHWPEQLVRDRHRPWLRPVRASLFTLLLLRLRVRRIPLVWTVHNLAPHEPGGLIESLLFRLFRGSVATAVTMTEATPDPGVPARTVIAHAHYREHFPREVLAERRPSSILHCGIIRPYKGVESLLAAFADLPDPAASLRIVGKPQTPDQADLVRSGCAADPRVSAHLGYADDATFVTELDAAQLVVLPYRGRMHNSGVLLAALSRGTPVLVPRSPVNEALAERVGHDWIVQYDGDLDATVLASALAVTAGRTGTPDLSAHDPSTVAARHGELYRELRGRDAGRRRP
ncbi:GDP-mannose--glycolipid 4-beta-D-mannosyltransferase [Kineococcus gynurae]|uniref:GDP-mannose--glycolipid 4-beta-D-mannosyltransferase n=1 Tax=Kineococcus gynurae TaxID=452979 RepID=A0ABV5LNP9_9ACTN